MKKTLKRFAIILVCVLTLCVFGIVFAACNSKSGGAKDTVTIQVVYPDGKAVGKDTVQVQVCVLDNSDNIITCLPTANTDKNGCATFKISTLKSSSEARHSESNPTTEYKYHIQLNNVPDEYVSVDENDEAYDYGSFSLKNKTSDDSETIKVTLIAKQA